MTEHEQGKFARKAQRILHREPPMSLADLMAEEVQHSESLVYGNPEDRDAVSLDARKPEKSGSAVREEFRLPTDLADTLREYAHQHRQKKTAVVIEALQDFFRQRHFVVTRREGS